MLRKLLIAVLGLAPLAAALCYWTGAIHTNLPTGVAHFAIAFILAPIATGVALLFRSRASLIIYMLLCLALATLPVGGRGAFASTASMVESIAALVMLAAGGLLIAREVHYRSVRYRRKSIRFFIQKKIALVGGKERHPAVLRDCSRIGVGVSLSRALASGFVKGLGKNTPVEVEVGTAKVTGTVAWSREVGEVINVGLAVPEGPVLNELIKQCRADPLLLGQSRIELLLQSKSVVAALAAVWSLAALLAFLLPGIA